MGQGKLWRGFRPHPALQPMHTYHDVGALANHEEFGDVMVKELMADDESENKTWTYMAVGDQ